jgi:predicted ATP-dependent endonuclease of OLD family
MGHKGERSLESSKGSGRVIEIYDTVIGVFSDEAEINLEVCHAPSEQTERPSGAHEPRLHAEFNRKLIAVNNHTARFIRLGLGGVLELISVTVRGLKKFADLQTLKTEGKLVAILGPNESGKTSLLGGIHRVREYGAYDSNDLTWDVNPPQIEVVAAFLLSADDHNKIGRSDVRLLKLIKRSEKVFQYSLQPWPEREKSARLKVRESISSFAELSWVKENARDKTILADGIEAIQSLVGRDDDDLSESEIQSFENIVSALKDNLRNEDQPRSVSSFFSRLEAAVASEKIEHPHRTIYGILKGQIPDIVYFSEEDRFIDDYYSFADLASAKEPPKGLSNLLMLAGANLPNLLRAHQEARKTEVRTILERANATLKEKLSPYWSQGELEVRLNYDDANLNVGIVEKDGRHSDLSQRSDGLRQFMALVAFLGVGYSIPPIVLIDEIERNLHYDAQADLVQVLEKQSVASKIIYTTHSAGALPSDLGRGVHLIKADPKTSRRSKVENRFWSTDSASGFQPLLIGLGASTLAFFPTRRAVICEGPSEMLLLPAMLREVTKRDIDFQVVPGLASVSATNVPALAANAKRVAYLTDSDPAGDAIVTKLLGADVSNKSILQLRTRSQNGFTLEDFISPRVLVGAAKRYLSRFVEGELKLDVTDLARAGRIATIKGALEAAGMNGFSKIDLAYDVLDFASDTESKLVDGKYQATLVRICQQIERLLVEPE